ncbi:MAG: hypothetical protein P8Y03_24620 [Anaerolineales bacterium]|jgi:hypothetical protein
MDHEPNYHSYLVRLWLAKPVGGRGEPPTWQGEVVHIQSGNKYAFQEIDHLLEYLQSQFEVEDNTDH